MHFLYFCLINTWHDKHVKNMKQVSEEPASQLGGWPGPSDTTDTPDTLAMGQLSPATAIPSSKVSACLLGLLA